MSGIQNRGQHPMSVALFPELTIRNCRKVRTISLWSAIERMMVRLRESHRDRDGIINRQLCIL
jgi:hypothetical protein